MNSNSIKSLLKRSILTSTTKSNPIPTFSYTIRSNSTASTSTLPPSSSSIPPPTSRSTPGTGTQLYNPSLSQITSHLNNLLNSHPTSVKVILSDEMAARCITHKSGEGGIAGEKKANGEKLSFVGRRILRLHLTLTLHKLLSHSPSALAHYLTQESLDNLLDTKELGSSVGKEWELEKVMRWREVRNAQGEASGLYKVRGAAVEGIVGAVYMQFGIQASSDLFKHLVLPNLILPVTLAKSLEEGEKLLIK